MGGRGLCWVLVDDNDDGGGVRDQKATFVNILFSESIIHLLIVNKSSIWHKLLNVFHKTLILYYLY